MCIRDSLSIGVLTADSIHTSEETGTLGDARWIARDLASQLGPRDALLAVAPADGPLEYYLAEWGVSRDVLRRDPSTADRVFAVVKTGREQVFEPVLRQRGLLDATWDALRPVYVYDSATVYVTQRRQ